MQGQSTWHPLAYFLEMCSCAGQQKCLDFISTRCWSRRFVFCWSKIHVFSFLRADVFTNASIPQSFITDTMWSLKIGALFAFCHVYLLSQFWSLYWRLCSVSARIWFRHGFPLLTVVTDVRCNRSYTLTQMTPAWDPKQLKEASFA